PTSASIAAEISPVYAPSAWALTSCPPKPMPRAPQADTRPSRWVAGGSTTTSTPAAGRPGAMSASRVAAELRLPLRFQLPATMRARMFRPRDMAGPQRLGLRARSCMPAQPPRSGQLDRAQPLFQVAVGRDRLRVTAGVVGGHAGRQHVDQEVRVRMQE